MTLYLLFRMTCFPSRVSCISAKIKLEARCKVGCYFCCSTGTVIIVLWSKQQGFLLLWCGSELGCVFSSEQIRLLVGKIHVGSQLLSTFVSPLMPCKLLAGLYGAHSIVKKLLRNFRKFISVSLNNPRQVR